MRRAMLPATLALAACAHQPAPPPVPFESGPSPACGGARAPTGLLLDQRIEVLGQERSYVLSVPEAYDPTKPMPLFFGWHGQGWTGEQFQNGGGGVEESSSGGGIFVYADGEPPGRGSGWDLSTDGDDVALFDALSQDLFRRYCIDRGRVFSFGRSFGGFFTHTLACARGDRIAGVADMIGGIAGDGCSVPISAWIGHNQDDPIVSFSSAQQARDRYRALGRCSEDTEPAEPSPCVRYLACQGGIQVVWCANPIGGHEPAAYTGP